MVAEMVALVRPGGMVASQEADFVGHLCDPPHAAWSRLLDAYHAYTRARGIDLFIGRRTHRLFRAAGVVDLHIDPIVRAFPLGQPRRMIIWQFIGNVRDQMVAEGFIGDAEMTALMAELKAHLDDPDTLVTGLFQFRVWVVSRADQGQPSRAGQWSTSSCMLDTRGGSSCSTISSWHFGSTWTTR